MVYLELWALGMDFSNQTFIDEGGGGTILPFSDRVQKAFILKQVIHHSVSQEKVDVIVKITCDGVNPKWNPCLWGEWEAKADLLR